MRKMIAAALLLPAVLLLSSCELMPEEADKEEKLKLKLKQKLKKGTKAGGKE